MTSRRSATSSSWSGNRCPYRSSVMLAVACPSICWTTLTLPPAAIAKDAAVCRRPCGVSRGSPMVVAAGPKRAPVEVAFAQHAAAGALEHQIIGTLPGKGRGDLLGQEPGERDRSLLARLGRVEDQPADVRPSSIIVPPADPTASRTVTGC